MASMGIKVGSGTAVVQVVPKGGLGKWDVGVGSAVKMIGAPGGQRLRSMISTRQVDRAVTLRLRIELGCRASGGGVGVENDGLIAGRGVDDRYSVVELVKGLVLSRVEGMAETSTAFVAAGLVLYSAFVMPIVARAAESGPFQTYFGTAASASSYGGYGGNASKRDSAEYIFDVPQGWKERLISKIEKGTNGTDSEFYNPKHKEEKVYVTFLAGFRKLAPRDNVLNNLALSDPSLQDLISYADDIKADDRQDSTGQVYYDYEIDSPVAHGLISVTCAKNKLYAQFVKAGPQDWARDESMLRHVHGSFQTIGELPLAPPGEF